MPREPDNSPLADPILGTLEDGGEMVVATTMLWFVLRQAVGAPEQPSPSFPA